jgi:hypothetical protein
VRHHHHKAPTGGLALRLRVARAVKRETAFDRYRRAKEERTRPAAQAARKVVAAQRPAPPPPPATEGRGWRVLSHPRASHQALEGHARNVWDFTWHGLPWPEGWRVRWGQMNAKELMSLADWIPHELGRRLGRAQCAISMDSKILGLCLPSQKLILIDEANHRELRRTPQQFAEVLIHELIHSQLGDPDHGPKFQAALKSALAHYCGSDGEPEPMPAGRKHSPAPAARP